MPYEHRVVRTVEFSETDMAGIVHYSNFFRYMETAEHAFFRELGYSIVMSNYDPPVGWPRVHAECDYRHPVRFEDTIEVRLLVKEKRSKSLSYLFRFRKLNAEPVLEVATGALTVVCAAHVTGGRMVSRHIPPELAAKIEVAPAELLACERKERGAPTA